MTSFNSIVYRARPIRYCGITASSRVFKSRPIRFSSTRVGSIKYASTSYKFSQVSLVARTWRRRLVQYAVLPPTSHPSKTFKESRYKLVARESDYSLADGFGANAKQDKDYLILKKSDFVQFGLKDNADWSISDFIAAWLLQGASKFKPNRQIRIQFYRCIHIIRGDKAYQKKSYIINSHSIFGTPEKHPSPKDFLA